MSASTEGQDTLKAVSQVRNLFKQVGLLLKTADDQMKGQGWQEKAGNYCVTGSSTTLPNPEYWMPYHVFRFYSRNSFPERLVAISVILDVEAEYRDLLNEPIASGIVYDYGEGQTVGTVTSEQYDYNYAGWHIYMPGYMPERKNDGTILVCTDPAATWPKDKCTAKRVASFAVPLVHISDSSTLFGRLVEPLHRLA